MSAPTQSLHTTVARVRAAQPSRGAEHFGSVWPVTVIGLLLAVLALGAAAAAPSASALEFGVCRHVLKKGLYSDANCQTKLVKPRGAYEWQPGPPQTCLPMKKGTFVDSSCTTHSKKANKGHFEKSYGGAFSSAYPPNPAALLLNGAEIYCSGSYSDGQILNATQFEWARLKLTGCEVREGGGECESEGSGAGNIEEWEGEYAKQTLNAPVFNAVQADWADPDSLPMFGSDGSGDGGVVCKTTPSSTRFYITPGEGGAGLQREEVGPINTSTTVLDQVFDPAVAPQSAEVQETNGANISTGVARFTINLEDHFAGPVEIKSP
jgi:hypothetical protein